MAAIMVLILLAWGLGVFVIALVTSPPLRTARESFEDQERAAHHKHTNPTQEVMQ